MSSKRSIVASLALTSLATPAAAEEAAPPSAFVGVLEDFKLDRSQRFQVRLAFRRTGEGWQALPDGKNVSDLQNAVVAVSAAQPTEVEWTVCAAGKNVGSLKTTRSAQTHFWAELGSQLPVEGVEIPKVGKPSDEFAGWMGSPVQRPLVSSSAKRCADPAGWKAATVPPKIMKALVPAMRKAAEGISVCTRDGKGAPYELRDEEITVRKAHASKDGASVVSLFIKPKKQPLLNGCEEVEGPQWADQLFHVDPQGKVTHLGTEMKFLDAGDYDGDGQSEVVFKIERYNNDGYALFFDGFKRSVPFNWNYH